MKRMKRVVKNLLSVLLGTAIIGALLVLVAGDAGWLNCWLFLGSLNGYLWFYVIYFLVRDPGTLERRSMLSSEKGDNLILGVIGILFVGSLVLSALDYRYQWSQTPLFVSLGGLAFLTVAYAILFLVARENTYASKGLRIHEGQRVISTGLYGVVRHPLYMGGTIMGIAVALTLGSLAGLIPGIGLPFVYAVRIRKEERMLLRELDGYEEYRNRVRFRLVPGVW